MKPRRAGERRHSVELQHIIGREASGDGYIDTWRTFDTVWASITPASASSVERRSAETQQVPVTHVVEIDWHPRLRAKDRLLFGTRPLYIRGWQNEDERDVTLVLSCEERAA